MKLISLQCQSCGAILEVDKEREFCFCSYCGAKNLIDKERKEITHRIVDEAKLKEIEYLERIEIEKQKVEFEKQKIADRKRFVALIFKMFLLVMWIVSLIILGVMCNETLDVAGFSPYHLILFPVAVFGIVIIIIQIVKFFKHN